MKFQLIRHATIWLEYAGKKFLVDPMFSKKGELAATPNTPNQKANPLIDLSMDIQEFLYPDAILLTHSHRDHFDNEAISLLAKDPLFLCQPADAEKAKQELFTNVQPLIDQYEWDDMTISRTDGQHGRGEIGRKMGEVSGYVLQSSNEPAVYIIGDSIWCEEVEQAVYQYKPEIVIAFAGAAQFLTGGVITMDKEDIKQLRFTAPASDIIVTHMEAWNHCLLTRKQLSDYLVQLDLMDGIHLPQDGEVLLFEKNPS